MEKINWGIIGCGDVCEVKSAPAMNLIQDSRLVAVMRRNEDKVRDYAARHKVPKWYTDAQALIDDPEVNAVYIATPPSSHAKYTALAAAAGKPVYVEKPMAISFRECEEMMECCEKAGVPLFVAYYRRCLPNFLKVKELVDAGAVGEIRMVQIELFQSIDPAIVRGGPQNWRVDPAIAGGGYFFDLASHQFDFLDYAFGTISKVQGLSGNQAGLYSAEDIVVANFAFENGIMGTGAWCFTASEPAKREQTTIVGSKGKIVFHYFTDSKVRLIREDKVEEFDFSMPKHIQYPLIQTIVDDLQGRGKCPSTGSSAARTNFILEKIL